MSEQLMQTMEVLFATFPPLSGAETPEGARNAMRAYLLALDGYQFADVQEGVKLIVSGRFPEHDGKYTPTAPQLARAVRHAASLRADSERRSQKPALPPPDIVHSPESLARVKAMAAEAIADLAASMRTEDAKRDTERKQFMARVNQRFAPDQSEEALRARLGFTSGDPEGDRDIA
jgi:hypothetical protein